MQTKNEHSINGVTGSIKTVTGDRAPGCFQKQEWTSVSRAVKGYGAGATLTVEIRFDDQCRNGHNDFAITAYVMTPRSRRLNDYEACGCLHDDIARVFPELADLVQWHLTSTRAPMHYVANTLYHATNWADSRYAPGEACQWETRVKFGNFPITFKFEKRFNVFLAARTAENLRATTENGGKFAPVAVPYVKTDGRDYDFAPHYTVTGDDTCKKWHEAPFKSLSEAQEFCEALNGYELTFEKIATAYAKEKARNLDAARNCANWPDATDEQLCAPRAELEAALLARLPAMMTGFRAAMENECGFKWEAPSEA